MHQITLDKATCGQDVSGWILCPSKTFPGKYYYFNVLSGECAWSLNVNDKEKLKNDEHINRADRFHSYPEPSSPPLHIISPSTFASASNIKPNLVNHSQNVCMMNKPAAPTYDRVCHNHLTNNNYCKTMPTEYCSHNAPTPQMMNCQPLWGIQPNYQIILAPAYPMQTEYFAANPLKRPMFDQNTQTSNVPNIQENSIWVHSTQTPLSRRFPSKYQNRKIYIPFLKRKVVVQNSTAFKILNKSIKKSKTSIEEAARQTVKAGDVSNLNQNDLRLLLLAKRRKSEDSEELARTCKKDMEEGESKTKKQVTFDFSNLDPAESILSDTTERCINVDVPEPQTPQPPEEQLFSSTRLREQAHRRDMWYVVVDLETLMRDLDFVEALVTSDTQCRLYLPLSVGSKLHALTRSFCSARHQVTAARKTARRLAAADWCVGM